MSISTHVPSGMQDAQLDNWLDLVLSYAPQVTCPECRAAFFALKGNGNCECPECGLELAVDLNSDHGEKHAGHFLCGRGRCAHHYPGHRANNCGGRGVVFLLPQGAGAHPAQGEDDRAAVACTFVKNTLPNFGSISLVHLASESQRL